MMYKSSRPKLAAMIAGDLVTKPGQFWEHVVSHLKSRKAKAMFVFEDFQAEHGLAQGLASVSRLQWHASNQGGTHKHGSVRVPYKYSTVL